MIEIEIFLPGILLAYLTYIIAVSSPGPATLAIMGVSMKHGRKSGVTFALGIVCGSICWAVLATIGLTQLIDPYGSALILIKILGGFYLLWMAYKALKSAWTGKDRSFMGTDSIKLSSKKLFVHGLALHLTNPKAVFTWVAIVSVGLQPNASSWITAIIVIGCELLGIGIFITYAFIFSNKKMVRLYQNARRPIEGILATVFGFAGFKLLSHDL
ncbi:LysE family translocator [Caldithrix abyssi]|nr:LysE family translocator [Caldithrix abyssi]